MEIDLQETINQLGGKGLSGALVYTGTSQIAHQTTDTLAFKVNGRRGYKTYITIQLDFSDTYNVKLISVKGAKLTEHDSKTNVYCDEIKTVFEAMYDKHMNDHNNNFIPC
jgi:hypothetical protein